MIELTDSLLWIIVGGCFVAAFINAAFAIGGAFLMLALMASLLPISAVIPMHSTLMLGSLVSRAWLFRQYIYWPIVIPFAIGCVIGVFAGARVYISLPEWIIALVIGCLMLSVWLPGVKWGGKIPKPFFWVGVVHSFMSTVFAYGGIFHAVVLRTGLDKMQVTATIAGSLLTMGLMKMTGYVAFGFDYVPYTLVIVGAILVSFVGTWVGKRCAHRVPEQHFRLIFKSILTLFGLRLLYQAWGLYQVSPG